MVDGARLESVHPHIGDVIETHSRPITPEHHRKLAKHCERRVAPERVAE